MSPRGSQVNAGGLSYAEILKRVEEGEIDGVCPAGLIQHYGKGVSKNPDEAFRRCFCAAEEGSAPAQAFVGYCFLQGIGVKQNGSRAFYWYKLAADQGHALAQYTLGCMCSVGRGTHKSYRRAAQWLLLAAEQNHPEAMESMVRIYKMGRGVKKNKALAFSFLKRAGATKLASAQYHLGIAYVYKSYGEMDVEYGMRLLESAAENGIEKAKRYLKELNEFIVDPFVSFYCELPEDFQIPLRRKTILLLDQVGSPLYAEMADDLRDFIALNPESGFHFLEYLAKLEECADREHRSL